jgi:formylmethanofuran dehydrogenase subunit B
MSIVTTVCTGCALACEDVVIDGADIFNACRKGTEYLKTNLKRELDVEGFAELIAQELDKASTPLIYGLSNLSQEAVGYALDIAEKVGARVDNETSLYHGHVLELLLRGELREVSLDWIKDNADVIIYLFCDPLSTHPRHLSMYSYYPRGERRQQGWEKDRKTVCIDAHQSSCGRVVNKYMKVEYAEINKFYTILSDAMAGSVPRPTKYVGQKEIINLVRLIKRAEDGVVIIGDEAVKNEELKAFLELKETLELRTTFSFSPLFLNANSRGACTLMMERSGSINAIKYDDGWTKSEPVYKGGADLIIDLCGDVLFELPCNDAKIISLSPHPTLTTKLAHHSFPVAKLGLDEGGEIVRLDGKAVKIPQLYEDRPKNSDILKEVLNLL